jgi:hypothetical protein
MAINKCDQCFYALMDKDSEPPCVTCKGYSNFVKNDVYVPNHYSKTLTEAIDDWFKEGVNGVTKEDFWYDTVEKPKHYMLFEEQGIEVRDVIKKLVNKFDTEELHDFYSHMFIADYVQMMQYVMRFMDKNGVEDLKKARWYLDKMIEDYEHHV